MAKTYDAHLFICTNRRDPGPDGKPRPSCAQRNAEALRDAVKAAAAKRFSGQAFRVNASGCLGACDEGIAAVCYGSSSGGRWQLSLANDAQSAEILIRTLEKSL